MLWHQALSDPPALVYSKLGDVLIDVIGEMPVVLIDVTGENVPAAVCATISVQPEGHAGAEPMPVSVMVDFAGV